MLRIQKFDQNGSIKTEIVKSYVDAKRINEK